MSKVLSELPGRPADRDRVLGWPGHLRRSGVDARARRFPTPTPPTSGSTTSRISTPSPAAASPTAPKARLVDRIAPLVEEGLAALACGAFHPLRRADLLQHHPAGPGRRRHPARARHARRRRVHLGRRVDLQGQRHRAVLPLRPARQPEPADLQAVAGPGVRHRARGAPRDVGLAGAARYPTATPPRRRTRPTPTSGAPPTRPSASSCSARPWRSSRRSWASRSGTPR